MRFVPIVVLSSYTQHKHVTQARDAGANLVLTKPVSPQVLFDHIALVAKAPRPFIEGQLRAIVGVELEITRIEAKAKLSQNRPPADVEGVIAGLRARGDKESADAVERARG